MRSWSLVDKRQVKIRGGKGEVCWQPACACAERSSQEVCRLIVVTLHALPLNVPAIAHNDTLYLRWCVWIRRGGEMFIVDGAPGGARRWKNRSWKTRCFGGQAAVCFCNRHHYQGPWSPHRERGGGNKRYVIPHGTQREGKDGTRCGCRVCLPCFLFPCSTSPSLLASSWLRHGASHRVVDFLSWCDASLLLESGYWRSIAGWILFNQSFLRFNLTF